MKRKLGKRTEKTRSGPTAESGSKRATELELPTRGKKWAFRLVALVVVPVLLLTLLEVGLRLAGYGYPTRFLLPASFNGKSFLIQNNQFSWRFFGRQMARTPWPVALARPKAPTTVRIFVFGESAAFGDPQPRFGLPRMLEALLTLRHPGTRFEVVNAAMTAINSHVILPIARDCSRARGDIWVIYMGNNEVVGPFGAGTVFGPATPPLPVIRASLAFRATRTGQLLDAIGKRLRPAPGSPQEWGGMMMFTNHQVALDDPRLKAVYDNFEQNLDDIIGVGQNSGAAIVLSTVAVNLKDCAPFGSLHRKGLSQAEEQKWQQLYATGIAAQEQNHLAEAADYFGKAAQIDDRFAELQFRQGTCALALGRIPQAQRYFQEARDLDTLRFRCDTRLNDLIRRAAASQHHNPLLLADAERAFADASPEGLPGEEFFYEHVHLTFEGDYLLARTIAREVEKVLPEAVTKNTSSLRSWPSAQDCAQRLAWTDWDLHAAVSDIYSRLSDPPFTSQLNHAQQMRRFATLLQHLAPAVEPGGIKQALESCRAALSLAPNDPWLHAQAAALAELSGDLAGAEASAQRWVELLPSSGEGWSRLGFILARQKQYAQAAVDFRRAFQLDSQDVWSRQNLAQTLIKLGRPRDAMEEYRQALAINPRFGLAWLGLGQLLEQEGQKNEAEEDYGRALANRIHRAPELATLARFCQSRGWLAAAATNYADALLLSPADPGLQLEAGQNLATLGRHLEAAECYAEAVRLAPTIPQAHFLLGLELGRQNRPADAAKQFQETVRLMPDLLEARLNLGIALSRSGRLDEAREQFQEVLQRSPTNSVARHYLELLRPKPEEPPRP